MKNTIWDRRPRDLYDGQLIAWALTEVALAIHAHYDAIVEKISQLPEEEEDPK